MSAETIRVRALIRGTVQGVGYRYSTVQKAHQLGLHGWVRNLPDGRVEAAFEGDPAAVEVAIAWCHQGPPAAYVTAVATRPETPEGLQGFETRY